MLADPLRIALLRGVNVGGAGKLPMAAFRDLLAGLGLGHPQTFIQSGNALFDSDLADGDLAGLIAGAVAGRFGFRPEVILLRRAELEQVLTGHPFGAAAPEHLHALFFAEGAMPDLTGFAAVAGAGEAWALAPRAVILHLPGGMARSRLGNRASALIGTPTTARNLRSVAGLVQMARGR